MFAKWFNNNTLFNNENLFDCKMMKTCPICRLEFDAVRWDGFKSRHRDFFICDNCISDKTRHRIVYNYLVYEPDYHNYITTKNGFDKLINFMALSDRYDFYNWVLREALKYRFLDHNILMVGSPYPIIFKQLIKFIINEFSNEFFDYIYKKLSNTRNFIIKELGNEFFKSIDEELRNRKDYFDYFKYRISNIIQNSELINYIDDKKLRESLTSISTIFDRLFYEKFDVSTLSEEETDILVDNIKSNWNLDAWYNFATELEKKSLIQLIKSLIYIENNKQISSHHNCSPIIALCKIILNPFKNLTECKDADNEALILIDWILKNSMNRYLPLGENNFYANSLEEYNEYLDLFKDSNAKLLLEEEELIQKKSDLVDDIATKQETIEILQKEITQKKLLVDHKQKSFKRIYKLKELNELNPIEKLEFISREEKPLQYYPEYLINIDKKYFENMDSKSKSSLKTKLKSVKKGYYKKLKKFID